MALTGKKRGKAAKPGFDIETLKALAEDLQSGRTPLDKIAISDDRQVGLRAIIRNTGAISFHVQYQSGDKRPYLKIGEYPGINVDKARARAKVITNLAARGVDVMEGLHDRLLKEIDDKGERWKP